MALRVAARNSSAGRQGLRHHQSAYDTSSRCGLQQGGVQNFELGQVACRPHAEELARLVREVGWVEQVG